MLDSPFACEPRSRPCTWYLRRTVRGGLEIAPYYLPIRAGFQPHPAAGPVFARALLSRPRHNPPLIGNRVWGSRFRKGLHSQQATVTHSARLLLALVARP